MGRKTNREGVIRLSTSSPSSATLSKRGKWQKESTAPLPTGLTERQTKEMVSLMRYDYLQRAKQAHDDPQATGWAQPLTTLYEEAERRLILADKSLWEVEYELCRLSRDYFTRRWLWIEHKRTRNLSLFTPNAMQIKRRLSATDFDIYLKARKEGVSTDVSAEFFHATLFTPLVKTVVVAHDDETVITLFATPTRFFEHLPPFLKPTTKYSNRRELIFAKSAMGEELDSHYIVATAGNAQTGRGKDVDLLHLSEAAFYNDLNAILSGIGEALRPGGKARIETTYKFTGAGAEAFKQLYDESLAGQNKWKVQFFAWFEDRDCQTEPPPDFELTEEEEHLKVRFHLSDAQLRWRRLKKADLRGDFDSEYPATPADAFKVKSGSMRFDADSLEAMLTRCRPPIAIEENGGLSLWKHPEPGLSYVVGADTSEGSEGSTFCAAEVVDAETAEQVAELHGRWGDSVYAQKLTALCKRYNSAMLCVERNNTGHAVIANLLHVERYDNLFVDHDRKVGWNTDVVSRPLLLDMVDKFIQTGKWQVNGEGLVSEMQGVVYHPDHKPRAARGRYDDRVFAAGIALCARARGELTASITLSKEPTDAEQETYKMSVYAMSEEEVGAEIKRLEEKLRVRR